MFVQSCTIPSHPPKLLTSTVCERDDDAEDCYCYCYSFIKVSKCFSFSPSAPQFVSYLSFYSFHSQQSSGYNNNHPKPRNGSGLETDLGFTALEDALISFDKLAQMRPFPSVRKFNKLLSAIARNKHNSTTLSLILQLDLLDINPLVPDIFTFNIAISCFCGLCKVGFGFSVWGKIFKLGYEPDCAIFNSVIRGLCADGKLVHAVEFFDKIVVNGL